MPVSSAEVLREARRRAGLTQASLAQRAHVTQSVISAYESGRREPSLPMLRKLIAAAGLELSITVQERTTSALEGWLGRRIRDHRTEILDVTTSHGLTDLRVFGSVARGEETSTSDVDLIFHSPGGIGLIGLARVQADLQRILGVPVDLVPDDSLKPALRDLVDHEAVSL